ncbi:MAG: RodZ domain-containing protein [Pseudomonadota bacterium]
MDQDHPTALRGFDSYEIRLGDELRGHRATLGKSLLDVQRELRIKASYIDAIENCDPSVIPNRGFVPGYVRAYARYLHLDADQIYARFCSESGFVGQTTQAARPGAAPRGGFRLGAGAGPSAPARDPALSRSHFASPVGRARPVGLGFSLSDLASVAVLIALIGGLGWGGWELVQDIQRVDFAPANEAPEMAEAPANVAMPGLAVQAAPAAWPGYSEERDAALAELYAPQDPEPPEVQLRDGPIAAIDPERSGLYARPERPRPGTTTRVADADPSGQAEESEPQPDPAKKPATNTLLAEAPPLAEMSPDRLPSASLGRVPAAAPTRIAAADPTAALAAPPGAAPRTQPGAEGVWLVISAPAWVQVKAADGSVLMQRIMEAGERWRVPAEAGAPRLRAGNAGGVYLEADGVLHGPLGAPGAVVKNVSLSGEEVAADWPVAPRARLARD